jgi:hypothetical protein
MMTGCVGAVAQCIGVCLTAAEDGHAPQGAASANGSTVETALDVPVASLSSGIPLNENGGASTVAGGQAK